MQKIIKHLKENNTKFSNEIVIFSDLVKLIIDNKLNKADLNNFLDEILDILLTKHRTIIMPSFINPVKNEIINLDQKKSQTGVLSEIFRNKSNVLRTKSPFFSWLALGKEKYTFSKLNPLYEWSKNSTLEWMEEKNSTFLIIGSYPSNNTFLHRIELKNKVNYRKWEEYTNKIIYMGEKFNHRQFYFELKKNYSHRDYTKLFKNLNHKELNINYVSNIPISYYSAKGLEKIYGKILKNDSYFRDGI